MCAFTYATYVAKAFSVHLIVQMFNSITICTEIVGIVTFFLHICDQRVVVFTASLNVKQTNKM